MKNPNDDAIDYTEMTREKLAALGDVFWGPPGEEQYHHSDIEDAIDSILDDAHPTVPDEVVVVAMKPRHLTAGDISGCMVGVVIWQAQP